jgi:5-enolpyruvylshikimate-3-phosphate synthase
MRQLNNHIKEVMEITPTKKSTAPKKVKVKTDYTKSIVWISAGAITVLLWTIIYNLIF